MADPDLVDCLLIGAGPAGLVAATYLTRFHRRIVVVDAGASRAHWIPRTHNCPGFPFGVSGDDLLAKLRTQAEGYGAPIVLGRIRSLERDGDGFVALDEQGQAHHAKFVVLATGIVDRLPSFEGGSKALEEAIRAGAIRLCAVCDGYEASDERIAVYGPADEAIRHAVFLRTFSRRVSVVLSEAGDPSKECRGLARAAGVEVLPVARTLEFREGGACAVELAGAEPSRCFDTIYPVLGGSAQSQLAAALGARVDRAGELVVDAKQETSVDGLYAIGDVVSGLNQISVAMGHAAIAASAIHQRLPPNFREDEASQPETAPDLPSP